LIGNERVKNQVRVALDAGFQDSTRFPHAVLCGDAGLGKSTLAYVISQEMATPFHEVLGQNLQKPADLVAVLLKATDKSIVHIDECHELPRQIQTQLYICLDQRRLMLPSSGSVSSIPLEDFTLLLSTTDEHRILAPLLSRMRLKFHLEFFTYKQLERVVATRAKQQEWALDDAILPLIATRARGTARKALDILQSGRRMCRSEAETVITEEHLRRACEIDGIDSVGLDRRDRQYLRLLIEKPTRVNVLASSLGCPAKTLETHLEPSLIRLGWLTKDEQGRRCITGKAISHLKEVGDE
jgi:Holliday junction DNA helicase RuvB